jgi:hypothetical protein
MQQLGTPISEVEIDVSLVTGLLQEQHRDLAQLSSFGRWEIRIIYVINVYLLASFRNEKPFIWR